MGACRWPHACCTWVCALSRAFCRIPARQGVEISGELFRIGKPVAESWTGRKMWSCPQGQIEHFRQGHCPVVLSEVLPISCLYCHSVFYLGWLTDWWRPLCGQGEGGPSPVTPGWNASRPICHGQGLPPPLSTGITFLVRNCHQLQDP